MELETARRQLKGLRVLLVEDSSFLGAIFAEMLGEAGCHVCGPLNSLQAAMDAARSSSFDAAVMDISIEGEPSFPVADLLDSSDVPVLLMSGYGSHAVPEKFRPTFLQKPFDEIGLLTALMHSLGARKGAAA